MPPPHPKTDTTYDPFASPEFTTFIENTLKETHTPGVSIAVIHGSKTHTTAHGHANLQTQEPFTPHTLFYAASTTKSFIAALTSKLIYDNNPLPAQTKPDITITWNTPLSQLIKEDFVLQDSYATEHVTLLDALSHRTGLPRHDLVWQNKGIDMREMTRALRHVRLHTELRTEWEYCNLMYSAVGHALETVTGRTLEDLLREWIFGPLGMGDCRYCHLGEVVEEVGEGKVARGYLWDEMREVFYAASWESMPVPNAAGGIVGNVVDYAKWVRLFLKDSKKDDEEEKEEGGKNKVLDSRAIETMMQGHMVLPPDDGSDGTIGQDVYGLGLFSSIYRGYKVVHHGGGGPGQASIMKWIPELNWGVVVFANSYGLAQMVVAAHLIDDFLQTPEAERVDSLGNIGAMRARKIKKAEAAKERLFPHSPKNATVDPVKPLEEYEGVYHHPAYHSFTISTSIPETIKDTSTQGKLLRLYASPTAKDACSDIFAVYEHVNGEHWLARQSSGIQSWLTDEYQKVQFVIGVDGKVEGMRLQAEIALDELAWFEKTQ